MSPVTRPRGVDNVAGDKAGDSQRPDIETAEAQGRNRAADKDGHRVDRRSGKPKSPRQTTDEKGDRAEGEEDQ